MSNDLVSQASSGALSELPDYGTAAYFSDDKFDKLVTASGFLPRLQLFGSNTDAVKEGKIPMAHFGLVRAKDDIQDLGAQVDLIPLSIRLAAMRLVEGNPISVYNPEHPEFKQIMADSEEQNSKCVYGPQFLVYVPSIKTFATFLFGSKTARREGRNMKPLLRRAATVKAKLISNQTYKWHSPIVLPCSTPLAGPEDMDYTKEIVDKFNNPEETSVEFDPVKVESERAR